MTRTLPTLCATCGVLFNAKSLQAAYCSTNCRVRAHYYRRKGRPVPPKGAITRTQPIRPAAVQSEILDDLPLAWQLPQADPAPLTALAPFTYDGRQVRVITDKDGVPWFVAADVCAVLELGNPTRALSRLDDDEKTLIANKDQGQREAPTMNAVNEPGLYSLILGSRKPEARAFKRWVTHEVLPAIRKTGGYGIAPAAPALPAATLPEGVYVIAATKRRAAELWWRALQCDVMATLADRFDPRHRTDSGLPLRVGYTWQPSLF